MSFQDDLDRQRAQIMRAVRQAGNDWAEAMRAHKLAPPDAGFAARLRALSEAAGREQVAWEHAHAAGLMWRPIPGAENAEPPYELRPGTGRRGPAELWARFDETRGGAQPRDHRIERRRGRRRVRRAGGGGRGARRRGRERGRGRRARASRTAA